MGNLPLTAAVAVALTMEEDWELSEEEILQRVRKKLEAWERGEAHDSLSCQHNLGSSIRLLAELVDRRVSPRIGGLE